MMNANERVKAGWLWVAVVMLAGYAMRTLYDIQSMDMPPLLGGGITAVVFGLFVAQLVATLLVEGTGGGEGGPSAPPVYRDGRAVTPAMPTCSCAVWLDENRVARGLTVERFPDDHVLGRFHYVDCPLDEACMEAAT